MEKEKIYYKWWFQFIVIAIICVVFVIAFKMASPTTTVNKKVSSYSTSSIQNSPMRTLSAFLRAIYTEDTGLLRKSVTKRTIYDYEDDFYNNHITENDLKNELKKENSILKSQFGDKWFYNTTFIEYGRQSEGDGRTYVVKVNWPNNKQTYISAESYGLGLGLDSYVTSLTFRQFLHENKID